MWEYEHRVETNAPAATVWQHWSDMASWPTWNAGIAALQVDGPFAPGTTFTMTPRMAVSALVQYNSADGSLTSNLRFRWEYIPGSEVFAVYSEGRSTFPPRGTALETRGLVVKVNRLFRF